MLFGIYIFSSEKSVFRSSTHFWGFFFFLREGFFFIQTAWAICVYWRVIPCQSYQLQIFSLILWLAFLCIVSFAVQKLLSMIRSHLCFYFRYSRRWIKKDTAVIYVRVFWLSFTLRIFKIRLYLLYSVLQQTELAICSVTKSCLTLRVTPWTVATRPPCPSLSPRHCSNSHPLSW